MQLKAFSQLAPTLKIARQMLHGDGTQSLDQQGKSHINMVRAKECFIGYFAFVFAIGSLR